MKKEDFQIDADQFPRELGVAKFAIKGAIEKLERMVEHWVDLGQNYLGKAVSFTSVPDKCRIDGEALQKKFSILYAPLSREANGVLEVVVRTDSFVTGEAFTVGRFLLKPDGAVLSPEGDELINRDDPEWSYKVMVAIVKRVLTTPASEA